MAAQGLTLRSLRRQAITQSLFPPSTLADAVDRLGFVQADPIRAPARAQDLILRHRVEGYRAGDLERQYPSLDVEEDYLYAYGFLAKRVWRLLHPRKAAQARAFERKVLDTVVRLGEAHPRALEAHLGKRRVVNAWGGYSKATTSALEWLHWRGLLRIARRESGIRIYRPAPSVVEGRASAHGASPESSERLRALIMVYARIFSPSPERSLQSVIARHRDLGNTRKALAALIADGTLGRDVVDNVSYVAPSDEQTSDEPRQVRFLAPFDPVVWDRARFEHLWGWAYRFEAYTPVKKRVRGYYAMPMLWQTAFTGWANASIHNGLLDVQVGFIDKKPRDPAFRRELEAEIARLAEFLKPSDT